LVYHTSTPELLFFVVDWFFLEIMASAPGATMGQRTGSQLSFPKSKIRVLLLEGIHEQAVQMLQDETFDVTTEKKSYSEQELLECIGDYHVIGLRSKTRLTAKVLEKAHRLLAIGCFCIGTDQVDLVAAAGMGVPVFNSPFCNSRSVAELVIAEIISLSRRLPDRIREMHNGEWNKVSAGCVEVRGKTLGIVGYGHIGSQLSVLAEALGLRVVFFDTATLMPLGNAQARGSLEEVLRESDYVTLHVPKSPETNDMIGEAQLKMMKPGAMLLNNARGTVVVLDALAAALKSGHLGGAAVDVYPSEPASNGPGWENVLRGLENVILTPHIGGSTAEAQAAIGVEVAGKLIKLVNEGGTGTCVPPFPSLELPFLGPHSHRVINIHKNKPGMMAAINATLADVNVRAQVVGTSDVVGYCIVDVEAKKGAEVKKQINKIDGMIRTRILY
jgi:D-3-phosphoglycerate dehydrogenase / 2-oxoglutarate reductase